MRSLSTKATKTYDIDITLILVQLHVTLSNFVWINTGKNVYIFNLYYLIIFVTHFFVENVTLKKIGCYTGSSY